MATYLDYAPTHTGDANSYTSCFERLGFRITPNTTLKRNMLFNHLKAHADDSVYKFLRSTDNGAAFKVMVSEFLVEHGEEYWGLSNREHLAEPDVSKGFFYPRDANRGGSRFLDALGNVFNYRAKARVYHMWRIDGPAGTNNIVDYEAMTERKADTLALSPVEPRPTLKSDKRRPSSAQPHDDHEEDGKEDIDNDREPPTGSWNFFDPVEKKTRLRPSSSISHQLNRHLSADVEDPPLLHKRQRAQPHHFTPPVSYAPSTTPTVSSPQQVIDLGSSPERELPKLQTSNDKPPHPIPSEKKPSPKTKINSANIKPEPIFAGHRARTFLRVEASNDDKAPITVPFGAWKTSEQLFSTLIKEQGLRPELGKKVKQISATYTWNKRRHGIRRGREEDWDRFCKTVQRAWEMESDKFDDECEIEMVLHVDQ